MIPENVLNQAVWRIHSVPDLAGCIVGYHGNGVCRTIGYPSCVTPNSENVAVIIEEVVLTTPVAAVSATAQPVVASPQARSIVTNRSKIGAELAGTGASCGLTLMSAAGVVAGVAGEVPTGGMSTILLVASWSGLMMGAVQCGNGLVRVGAALADLDGDTLDRWDRNSGYSTIILIVDAIGVAGSLASLPFAVRNAWAVVTRLKALKGLDLSMEALRRLNRTERFKLIARLFNEASRIPEGAHALVDAAREVHIGARVFQRASTLSVNHSATLVKIIRDATVKRLHWSLLEVFAGVAGNVLSATPAELTGSGSGSINWVINLIDAGSPVAP
jgi:hypothetical protein